MERAPDDIYQSIAEFMLKMDQILLPERFKQIDKDNLTREQIDFIYKELRKHIYNFEKAYKFRPNDLRELNKIPNSAKQLVEQDTLGYHHHLLATCEELLNPNQDEDGKQRFKAFSLFLSGAPATIIANRLGCTAEEAQKLVNDALDAIGNELGTEINRFKLRTVTDSPTSEGLGRILNRQEVTIDLTESKKQIAGKLGISEGFAAKLKKEARENSSDEGKTGKAHLIPNFHQTNRVEPNISFADKSTEELQKNFNLTHDQARRLREKSMKLAKIPKRNKRDYTPNRDPKTGKIIK